MYTVYDAIQELCHSYIGHALTMCHESKTFVWDINTGTSAAAQKNTANELIRTIRLTSTIYLLCSNSVVIVIRLILFH